MLKYKDRKIYIITDSIEFSKHICSQLNIFNHILTKSEKTCLSSSEDYDDSVIIFDLDENFMGFRDLLNINDSIKIGILGDNLKDRIIEFLEHGYDDILHIDEINYLQNTIIKNIYKHQKIKDTYIREVSIMHRFNSILNDLNKELDIEKLLNKSIDALKTILSVEKASILLFEDEELILKACIGLPATVKSGLKTLKKNSISYFVAKNKKSIMINDIDKEERFNDLRSGTNYKKRSFISSPIMFFQTVIGVINLNDKLDGDFSENDLKIIDIFGSHLAINIVNAHLFLDLKDKASKLLKVNREKDKLNQKISDFNDILKEKIEKEKEKVKNAYQELIERDNILQKKILELISLKKAGKTAISELFNIELVLDVILNIALREVDALRGSIVLKDKEDRLMVKAAAGQAKDIVNTFVSSDDKITHYIFEKAKPLLIRDIEKHPILKKTNIKEKYNTKSLLSLPLIAGDKIYGIMNVNNKHNKRPFNNDDLDILYALANHASMAIHNYYLSQELRDKEKSLQQAEKMAEIGNLVVAVAHEIRNPLGILRTNIEYLSEIMDSNKDILENMNLQIERTRRFIKDLMQYGKPTQINIINTDIIDVLDLSLNHSISGYKKIEGLNIKKFYPKGNVLVNIDPIKVQQVFVNIIINSFDELFYSDSPQITLKVSEFQDNVSIEIMDNGSGISSDSANDIFKPFFSLKREEKGTGLGLSIAKRIIDMHNGRIYLDSAYRNGAKFIITIPK